MTAGGGIIRSTSTSRRAGSSPATEVPATSRHGSGGARTSIASARTEASPSRCSSGTLPGCSWSTATTPRTRTTPCCCGKDLFFYSISLDPEHDTPAVLKAYAEKFHVGPGWLFLTGKKDDITLVAKKLGLSSRTD